MNLQQVVQPRSSTNGFGRRRVDREMGTRMESNLHSGKSISSNFHNAVNGGKIGGLESPSRDRLIYIVTSLIGHRVEVHVRNGSILSGFFYATNAEKDFGIVLKMAQVVKDGTVRGQKPVSDAAKKPQTMIIPARELVQVLAKDVSLSNDEHTDGHAHEKRQDLMIDSVISQSHRVEERELEPWRPDEDDPECPELENIFDGTWNRNWDQFETNETLFGVKSTFDEELYTTKLERGPQMREIEREASRIAREIEGEETRDLHLAEERGIHFHEDLELDEESRFSAVRREVDDGRFEENENTMLDVCNTETFGGSLDSDEGASSRIPAGRDIHRDHFRQLLSDSESLSVDDLSRMDDNQIQDQEEVKNFLNECIERNTFEEAQTSKSKEIQPSQKMKGLSPSATAYAPSSSGQDIKHSVGESVESAVSGKASVAVEPVHPHVRPGSATSSTSERVVAGSVSSGPGLSPSSSVGSLSSEKSSLNPYAKEFKLNPNAKSFTPSAPSRPHMPISEGSFYYTSNIPAAPHMHSLPVGFGIGPSFGGPQPVVYNTQAAQMQPPQAYIHPNGPLYGQQMILGQPRPVMYMPSYPPELPIKGRDF